MRQLKNGAYVLESKATVDGEIVLAKWKNEYVTWMIDKEGDAHWGHYISDLPSACEDFSNR